MTTNHPDPTPPPAEPAPSLRPVEELHRLVEQIVMARGWREALRAAVAAADAWIRERDDLRAQLAAAQAQLAEANVLAGAVIGRLNYAAKRAEAAEARLEAVRVVRDRICVWAADDEPPTHTLAAKWVHDLDAAINGTKPLGVYGPSPAPLLRASVTALSAAPQPEPDDTLPSFFVCRERDCQCGELHEPPASDEPARCKHGEIEAHPHDDGKPPFVMKRCPGPAASGTPDGGS